MISNSPDPEWNRKVYELANTAEAMALEHVAEMAMRQYLTFFVEHGVPNVGASVCLMQTQPTDPTIGWLRQQRLESLAKFFKHATTEKEAIAAEIQQVLLNEVIRTGGH